MLAGLDQFVASTRINRYEKGIHKADVQTAERLARVLKVPVAYLYAGDERLARAILAFSRLSREQQDASLQEMEELGKV